MSGDVEMVVAGGGKILAGLDALGKAEQGLFKKTAKRVTRDALKPVHAAAKSNAPTASGNLAKSIKLRAWRRPKKGEVGMKVFIDTVAAPYGSSVESGYALAGRYVPGRHFVRRAGESKGPAAAAALAAALSQAATDAINGKT